MCGEYTDYTQSYHHLGAQFWVGSSRNWSVFLERPNTGRHDKAPVRCPYSRLAALHGAPRTQPTLSAAKASKHYLLVKTTFGGGAADAGNATTTFCFSAGDIEADHTDSGIVMDSADRNRETPHLGD